MVGVKVMVRARVRLRELAERAAARLEEGGTAYGARAACEIGHLGQHHLEPANRLGAERRVHAQRQLRLGGDMDMPPCATDGGSRPTQEGLPLVEGQLAWLGG